MSPVTRPTLATLGVGAAALAGGSALGWIVARRPGYALPALGLLLAAAVPATWLLAGGIVTTSAVNRTAVVGDLLMADLLMMAWLARTLIRPDKGGLRGPGAGRVGQALMLFLGWSILASYIDGASLTPLLRISLYAAVCLRLAYVPANRTLIYAVVTVFACWEIGGGILEGQTRLVGTHVGDPAQMGALILAALIPIALGELRFLSWGRWVVAAFLLYGVWLTQTRSIWFATTVVFAIWLFAGRGGGRTRTLVILGAVALIGFQVVGRVTAALGLNDSSAAYRIDNISNGLRAGIAHPLVGSGWANVVGVDTSGAILNTGEVVQPYNLFINVFASVGVLGLVLLLAWLWTLLGRLVRRKDTPFYFVVAVLAMSFTEMPFYAGSLLTVLFFVYAGLGLAGSREVRRNDDETSATSATSAGVVAVQ